MTMEDAGRGMGRPFRCLLAILLMSMATVSGQTEIRPTIVFYTGTDSGFARMLASLVEQADGIDSDVMVVAKPDALALATALPQTECIIVYGSNAAEVGSLVEPLTAFFESGGGLVGLREVCYEPSVGNLATRVFPACANVSAQQYPPGQKRARNYTEVQTTEIASGLPERFQLVSMGIYFRGDSAGKYLEVSEAEYSVAYADEATGAPIVLTCESEAGGRSVALPGIWVVSNSRVDAYYGNLVLDENFVQLFTNAVRWAAKGSTHFSEASRDFRNKLDDARSKQERLRDEAERARRKGNANRLLLLSGMWAAGLLACGVVIRKLILVPIEVEA